MLESDYTYIHLRPEPNGCMDVSLDDETSSMDEIPQKSVSKPQRKTKSTAGVLLESREQCYNT
jgi:hypothetical protein